jgi:CDP-glucose 4,6-dehydratase
MLEMNLFEDIYRGKRVLITGHSGFKGSWLTLWLHELGADLTGISLQPDNSPTHWALLQLKIKEYRTDIRDYAALKAIFETVQPEIVFHLAAQPLVRRSYVEPLETWSTNVLGTVNVLEASRHTKSVRSIIVVTTDKCYENLEWTRGYRESDRLGGHDPYSASKAGSELVAASYRKAYFNAPNTPLLATARAGNVIGGGDWSEDRLIPDCIRAVAQQKSFEIRSPFATRPWQHVLESLAGYLLLGYRLLKGDIDCAEAWNFGPSHEDNLTVSDVLFELNLHWPDLRWHITDLHHHHEATMLHLDSTKARTKLEWKSVWEFESSIRKTAEWYNEWLEKGKVVSREQLIDYIIAAKNLKAIWVSQ